ncbi:MAG: hypothetical protein O3C21_17585, partial [Verrucomicrobia bacterium]|nr:hypothetical protein [Verrucomicrobiota bacterium]
MNHLKFSRCGYVDIFPCVAQSAFGKIAKSGMNDPGSVHKQARKTEEQENHTDPGRELHHDEFDSFIPS